jgi:hypothetical protein
MHQPIYWPDESTWYPDEYEKAYETIQLGHSESNVSEIFDKEDRVHDYQEYPRYAIHDLLDLADAGAQVSFAGTLIENIISLAENGWNGGRYAPDWYRWYREAAAWPTSGGRPRCDLLLVSFHHPIAPLMDENALRMEVRTAKAIYGQAWGSAPSTKGFFPAETCFSERMIPILAGEGIEWTIVPDLHIARACADYPYQANLDNCDPPNRADQTNPAQANWNAITISRGCTVKTPVPYGFRPHRARYVDPETGAESKMIVVPAANAMGWDEGYGLYGTGQIDAIAPLNDPARPMLILFAHDGDNAWAGGYSYYHENVTGFSHAAAARGYEPTVIAEYLADHPIAADDVVHVEDGGWVNAEGDFGSPQFINWNWPLVDASGRFDIPNGWAEDERNWAVLTAAQNRVETAEAIDGPADPARVADPSLGASEVECAWHFLLAGYESGYMYYGASLDMEIKATLAANQATTRADAVIATGNDTVPPTIWIPQRLPWNPGGRGGGSLWGYPSGLGLPMDRDFYVWTFVHDVSGVEAATLRYRIDGDGANDPATDVNETYAGGSGVGEWISIPMTGRAMPLGDPYGNPEIDFSVLPSYIADEYWALVQGLSDQLVDYYVELVKRSPIQHVYVGSETGTGEPVSWDPETPVAGDTVRILYDLAQGALPPETNPVRIHIGHSGWQEILAPDPAMLWVAEDVWADTYAIPSYATSVDFVFTDGAGHWDNNNGADWHVPVSGGSQGFVLDGSLDEGAAMIASAGGMTLYAAHDDGHIYVATQSTGATTGLDHFILIGTEPSVASAPWAKSGTVYGKDFFLAEEGDNGWCGWFDSTETLLAGGAATGSFLEGVLARSRLGGATTVYLAAARYGSTDGGALALQAPPGDGDGNVEWAEYAAYGFIETAVSGGPFGSDITRLAFAPNPFRPGDQVRYQASASSEVRLSIYDVCGRLVRVLVDRPAGAGDLSAVWDGTDRNGRAAPAGVYFIRLESPGPASARKIVFIR